jgi:hypothetical protein
MGMASRSSCASEMVSNLADVRQRRLAMRLTAAILVLASGCAHGARRDGVAPQVHDYRQTRDVPVALTADTTPSAIIVPNPADSAPFSSIVAARRLKNGYVVAYSARGRRRDSTRFFLRELRFYDDASRLTWRMSDTIWASNGIAPAISSLCVKADQSIVVVTSDGKCKRRRFTRSSRMER